MLGTACSVAIGTTCSVAMSHTFLRAVEARASDVRQAIDDRKYKSIADSMVIDGDADVLAQVAGRAHRYRGRS